jgi:hypothetical protein
MNLIKTSKELSKWIHFVQLIYANKIYFKDTHDATVMAP